MRIVNFLKGFPAAAAACGLLSIGAPSRAEYAGLSAWVGGANPGDPAYQAGVESDYRALVSLMGGQAPYSTTVFLDYREPIWAPGQWDSQWSNNSGWAANAFRVYCNNTGRINAAGHITFIPIFSVPLTDDRTAFSGPNGAYNEPAAVAMMNDIANGRYDVDDPANGRRRVWPAVLDKWRDIGVKKMYLRIGWEQNGNWYGWQTRSPASVSAYVAAWRHLADLARAYGAANGMEIRTVWSPALGAVWSPAGAGVELTYPGDAYVDVIGPDCYSPVWNPTQGSGGAYYDWTTRQNVTLAAWLANPANREHYWDYPESTSSNPTGGGWGLPAAIAFARIRNKPFGLSETGAGNNGVTTQGGGPNDEARFPVYLGERLTAAMGQGLAVEFVDIWSITVDGDWGYLHGEKPNEAVAWRQFADMMALASVDLSPPARPRSLRAR